MDINNIPNDNREAEIYLKGARDCLIELLGEFVFVDNYPAVIGAIHSELDEIKELRSDTK